MDELWLIGRILFCALFIASGIGQLVDLEGSTRYATAKSIGPARTGVIASAVALIIGGVSVLFGIWGDLGALLLVITLIPLTFLMHQFWAERDPIVRFETYLRGRGESEAFFAEIAVEGDDLASDVRRRVVELVPPTASTMFDHVYSDPHPLMDEQRAWLAAYEASFEEGAR